MEQEWLQKVAFFEASLLDSESQYLQKPGVGVCLTIFKTPGSGYYLEACEKQNPEHVLFRTYLRKRQYRWNLERHTVVGFVNTMVSEQASLRTNDVEERTNEENRKDAGLGGQSSGNFLEPVVLYFENEEAATRFWNLLNETLEEKPSQILECQNHCASLLKACDSVDAQEADWEREETGVGDCLQQSEAVDKNMFLLQHAQESSADYLEGKEMEDSSILFSEPDLSKLDSIERMLKKTCSDKREQFLNQLKENTGILEKFIDLFHICEDLKMFSELKKLSNIIYSILISGNSSILELLLSDSYYYDIIGMLEYRNNDTSLTSHKNGEKKLVSCRVKLRKHLGKLLNIEDVVTFYDRQVAERVRLNQRLMFLKQNFFPILSEDHMLTVLNSVMFFNNLDVINYFRSKPESLDGLFETLKNFQMDGNTQSKQMYPCAILRFIYELCDLCKAQQQHIQQNKERFFGIFRIDNLLSVCCKFLMYSKNFQERFFCANIILILLNSFSSPVREYILKHVELFKAIVTALKQEDDFALSSSLSDIVCMLIDPDTTKDFLQKDEFLDLFYEDIVNELMASFDSLEPLDSVQDCNYSSCYSRAPFGSNVILAACQTCNILSHCVANHGYRPKYVIWRLNALSKACRLFVYHDTCISLYPLRLIRYCIGQRDEFYNRYIVKENILGLVFRAAELCVSRKNIFYCSLLEMLSFIDKSGMTLLIQHIGKHYLELLSSIFGDSRILHKYQGVVDEGKEDSLPSKEEPVSFLGKRRNAEIDSEERYFEENDEDNSSNGQVEWNVDRDLILPRVTKDTEEESSVFLQLCKEEPVSSPKVQKRRSPVVSLGKIGSNRPLVDYSWSEEEEPTTQPVTTQVEKNG